MLVIRGANDHFMIVYKFETGNKLVLIVDGSGTDFKDVLFGNSDADKLLFASVFSRVRSAHTVVTGDSPITRNLSAIELELYIDLALKEIRLAQPDVLSECGPTDRPRSVSDRYDIWPTGYIFGLSEPT